MKSYLQGLITGGVFVFAFMVLMGSAQITKNEYEQAKYDLRNVGKYQISTSMMSGTKNPQIYETIIDTQTGKVISRMKFLTMDYRYE